MANAYFNLKDGATGAMVSGVEIDFYANDVLHAENVVSDEWDGNALDPTFPQGAQLKGFAHDPQNRFPDQWWERRADMATAKHVTAGANQGEQWRLFPDKFSWTNAVVITEQIEAAGATVEIRSADGATLILTQTQGEYASDWFWYEADEFSSVLLPPSVHYNVRIIEADNRVTNHYGVFANPAKDLVGYADTPLAVDGQVHGTPPGSSSPYHPVITGNGSAINGTVSAIWVKEGA